MFNFQRRNKLPLHLASTLGNFKMVKFLLSRDCFRVDEEDSEGMTPILRYSKESNSITVLLSDIRVLIDSTSIRD